MDSGADGAHAVHLQPATALANVADEARRIAHHEAMIGDVPGDDRSGSHHRKPAHGDARQDRAAAADRCPFLDADPADRPVLQALEPAVGGDCSGALVIEKTAVRPDEDSVRQPGAFENGDPVLELDAISDDDVDVDVNALPQNAFRAY